jgi:hypothetical protein
MHSGSLATRDESRLASTLEVQCSRQLRISIPCTDSHIEGFVFMPTGANPENELLSLPIDCIFAARQSQSAKIQGKLDRHISRLASAGAPMECDIFKSSSHERVDKFNSVGIR